MLDQFIWIGAELFKQGLVDSHGGNMSVKIGDRILITRRNVRLGSIKEGDLIEVPLQGESPEDIQASRELVVHRALYQGTGAGAIIHAHPPYAIALSISENKIIPQDAEASFFLRAVPIIKVRGETIGSPDVAKLLPQFLNSNYVVAMVKSHGSYAIGSCLEEAYKYTSVLENSCKVTAILRSMGQNAVKPMVSDYSAAKPMGKPMGGPSRGRAIPPGIGVMDRSSKAYRRGSFK